MTGRIEGEGDTGGEVDKEIASLPLRFAQGFGSE